MPFLQVNVDLKKTTKALEKIADWLEWLVCHEIDPVGARAALKDGGPPGIRHKPLPRKPADPGAVSVVTDEMYYQQEIEAQENEGLPLTPDEEGV